MARYRKEIRGATVAPLAIVLAGLVVLFLGVEGAVQMSGDPLRDMLALQRPAVLSGGEVWRLVTAHTVHLGPMHLVLNLVGLTLATVTLWGVLTAGALLRVCAVSAATIGAGWLILQPDSLAYVGFSAIEHGMFAWGALVMLRRGDGFGWVVLGCVMAKLSFEAAGGALPSTTALIGGGLSQISHALGALGGVLAAGPGHGGQSRGAVAGWAGLVLACGALALIQATG